MALFLHNGPCSRCGSRDNLATYDDQSQWCWGCHFYRPSNISGFVTQQAQEEEEVEGPVFPTDLSKSFPSEVVSFISQYGITVEELLKNDYLWSQNSECLWRLFKDVSEREMAVAGEGRYVDSGRVEHAGRRHKSLFRGSKENIYPICKASDDKRKRKSLVLVEDSLSSIKVGRVCDSLPLLGASISIKKIEYIKRILKYEHVIVWLDHDKFREGWEIANKFKWLGVGAKVVLTKLDPKWYSEKEIEGFING